MQVNNDVMTIYRSSDRLVVSNGGFFNSVFLFDYCNSIYKWDTERYYNPLISDKDIVGDL